MSWTTRTRPLTPEHLEVLRNTISTGLLPGIPEERKQRWLRVAMGNLDRFRSEARFYQACMDARVLGTEVAITINVKDVASLAEMSLPPHTEETDDENAYEHNDGLLTVVIRRANKDVIKQLIAQALHRGFQINIEPPFGNQQRGDKMPMRMLPKAKEPVLPIPESPVQQVAKVTEPKTIRGAAAKDLHDAEQAAKPVKEKKVREPKAPKEPKAPAEPRTKDKYRIREGADVTGLKRLRLKIVEALADGPLTSDEIIAKTQLNGNSVRFNLGHPLAQWVEKVKG